MLIMLHITGIKAASPPSILNLYLMFHINYLYLIISLYKIADLKNTNVNSEMFLTKLKRAQDSLAHTNRAKCLTSSFGDKITYKRVVTSLSPMAFRQDKMGNIFV